MLSIPLPSLPLNIEWLKLRSALITIPVPQPMTSNPQPKPYDRFYSRYVSIKNNRAFSEVRLQIPTSEKVSKQAVFRALFLNP